MDGPDLTKPHLIGHLRDLTPEAALKFYRDILQQAADEKIENVPLFLAEDKDDRRFGTEIIVTEEGGIQEALIEIGKIMLVEGFFPDAVALFGEGWVTIDMEAAEQGRRPSEDPNRGEGVFISVATADHAWTALQLFARMGTEIVFEPDGPEMHDDKDNVAGGAVPLILRNLLRLDEFFTKAMKIEPKGWG